jgi:hypothetical protein
MNQGRLTKFRKWWKTNNHYKLAHRWLIKHSKRCIHNYHIAPEQFDHAISIIKRYNKGEYKRLAKADAYFLWRLVHPTLNARRERLLATAAFFDSIANHSKLQK